jgi:hypothetical protein
MRFSSLFVASLAVAILSSALLLCGLSGTARSQTATGSATSLPSIMVVAPEQVARPQRPQQVANTVASRQTAPTTQTPSPAQGSVLAKLAALEKTSSNCTDGCQTSFKYGNAPWHGCSGSGWPALSSTCRNIGNYKTYAECTEAGLITGWRGNEVSWYCSSLALK